MRYIFTTDNTAGEVSVVSCGIWHFFKLHVLAYVQFNGVVVFILKYNTIRKVAWKCYNYVIIIVSVLELRNVYKESGSENKYG